MNTHNIRRGTCIWRSFLSHSVSPSILFSLFGAEYFCPLLAGMFVRVERALFRSYTTAPDTDPRGVEKKREVRNSLTLWLCTFLRVKTAIFRLSEAALLGVSGEYIMRSKLWSLIGRFNWHLASEEWLITLISETMWRKWCYGWNTSWNKWAI